MKYNIIVKNRFTGKVLERHSNKSVNFLFETQDVYMLAFWIKVTVTKVRENDLREHYGLPRKDN